MKQQVLVGEHLAELFLELAKVCPLHMSLHWQTHMNRRSHCRHKNYLHTSCCFPRSWCCYCMNYPNCTGYTCNIYYKQGILKQKYFKEIPFYFCYKSGYPVVNSYPLEPMKSFEFNVFDDNDVDMAELDTSPIILRASFIA